MYENPAANILKGERLIIFPLRSGIKQIYLLSPLIQHGFESSSHFEIRQEKKKKERHTDWKGRNKTATICR